VGEDDEAFKTRVKAVLREEMGKAKEADLLVPQVVWGHFPANAEGNDWSSTRTTRAVPSGCASRSHARTRSPSTASRTSSDPRTAVRRLGVVPTGHHGLAHLRGDRTALRRRRVPAVSLPPRPRVEMARPWPSTGTAASARNWARRRGRTEPDRALSPAVPRGRYSWGYPACPDLTDNAKVVELLGGDRIGVEVSEGFQLHPEQTTDAIICHHPKAKYFIA